MLKIYLVRLALLTCAGAILFMTTLQPESGVTAAAPANPLLEKWVGPYGGVPPFDKVKIEDFKPALEAAMTENLAEVDAIANQKDAPTFENTIVAMERSGDTLNRVQTIFGIWSSNMSSKDFEPIDAEMSPKIAGHSDKIYQNEALFKRIEAVYNSPEKTKLTSEQQRLVWVYYNNFVHAGAKLDATKKKRLSEINQQLAGLYTKFSQNLLGDESELSLLIENEADLSGLPDSL